MKSYLFLATGFEEIEAITVIDILRRANIEVVTVSIEQTLLVKGAHNINIEADVFFNSQQFMDAKALILPGGMPGTKHLSEHKELCNMLELRQNDDILICAICAAPSVLGKLGILKGKKASCYPTFENELLGAELSFNSVVISGNTITSRGPGNAIEFALAIVSQLKGESVKKEVAQGLLYTL